MLYNVGDRIVYPMHGAGVIDNIEESKAFGSLSSYYVLKFPYGGMKVMIPIDKVEEIGIRSIVSSDDAERVFSVLKDHEQTNQTNWNKRYKMNLDRIKSGDIFEVARVVSSLLKRDKEKGLSSAERKMLSSARNILSSELVLSKDMSQEEVDKAIDRIIA